MSDSIDPSRFRLPAGATPPPPRASPPRRIKGKFLKGPIPLDWLTAAAGLRGSPLVVGLAVWYKAGLKKKTTVRFTGALAKQFGLDRNAKRRGLAALEVAKLIRVRRDLNKNPVVTLITAA